MILNEVSLEGGPRVTFVGTAQEHGISRAVLGRSDRAPGCEAHQVNRVSKSGVLRNGGLEFGEAVLFLRLLPELVQMFHSLRGWRMVAEHLQR